MYTTVLFIAICVLFNSLYAFSPVKVPRKLFSSKLHQMDGESKTDGYGPVGSLIRQGPVPFFIRVLKPDTYNAAVNKYMKKEGCSRIEAMGNMDAYFMDPNGWASRKIKEKKGELPLFDYVNVNTDPFQLALTTMWAVGIMGLGYRIFQVQMGQI
jgi:hypothetical protein